MDVGGDDDSKRKCVGWIFGFCGMGLIVVAIYFLASSADDTRTPLLDQYTQIVNAWETIYRPQFDSLNVSLQLLSNEYVAINSTDPVSDLVIPLVKSTTLDILRQEREHDDMPSYWPLKFISPSSLPITVNISSTNNRDVFINAKLLLTTATGQSLPDIDLPPIPLINHEVTFLNDKMCRNRGGQSIGGTCDVTTGLTKVCVTTYQEQTGNWSISRTSPGCGRSDTSSAMGSYLLLRWYSVSTASFSTIPFMLRSNHDPYLAALALTNGLLYFGNTVGENFVTGVICIVIGGVLLIPLLIQLIQSYRERKAWESYLSVAEQLHHEEAVRAASRDYPSSSSAYLSNRRGSSDSERRGSFDNREIVIRDLDNNIIMNSSIHSSLPQIPGSRTIDLSSLGNVLDVDSALLAARLGGGGGGGGYNSSNSSNSSSRGEMTERISPASSLSAASHLAPFGAGRRGRIGSREVGGGGDIELDEIRLEPTLRFGPTVARLDDL